MGGNSGEGVGQPWGGGTVGGGGNGSRAVFGCTGPLRPESFAGVGIEGGVGVRRRHIKGGGGWGVVIF